MDMTVIANVVAQALFTSTAIMAVVEYLKKPLVEAPVLKKLLVKYGLAYTSGEHVIMWWIPYLTFALGGFVSYYFGMDLITPFVPTAPVIGARIFTAAVVGGGANVIHNVTRIKD